jgi:hypothetical protein
LTGQRYLAAMLLRNKERTLAQQQAQQSAGLTRVVPDHQLPEYCMESLKYGFFFHYYFYYFFLANSGW